MEEPHDSHVQRAKMILGYIKGTLVERIFYANNSDMKLIGYINSDSTGDIETRKSILGYAFHLYTDAISWSKGTTNCRTLYNIS